MKLSKGLLRLLRWWMLHFKYEEISGDLEEIYFLRKESMNKTSAEIILVKEILQSFTFRDSKIKHFLTFNSMRGNIHLRLHESFRFLKKRPLVFIVQILGLAIGLTTFLMLFMFYENEKSFDSFYPEKNNIYRICTQLSPGDELGPVPWPVGPHLSNEFNTKTTRIYHTYNKVPFLKITNTDRSFFEDEVFFVDSTFFDVFHFKWIAGDKFSALKQQHSIVLTVSLAKKFFGDQNPIGQQLHFEGKVPLVVTGIIEDVPVNSHLSFTGVIPLINIDEIFEATGNRFTYKEWYWTAVNTYIKFDAPIDPYNFQKQLDAFSDKYVPEQLRDRRNFFLQPLTSIYLDSSHIEDYHIKKRSKSEVNAALYLGIIVLLIAMINYLNIASSFTIDRLQSIVTHKMIGANNFHILMRIVGEALIMCLIAFAISGALLFLALPYFNAFVNAEIIWANFMTFQYASQLILFTLVLIGILCAFPFVQANKLLQKVTANGLKMTNQQLGLNWFRKGLIGVQFFAAIFLIFTTFVIRNQFKLLQNKDLGFDQSQVYMIPVKGTAITGNVNLFIDEIKRINGVLSAEVVSDVIGQKLPAVRFRLNNDPKPTSIATLFTGFNFLETYNVKLTNGRNFNPSIATDSIAYLVNESALNLLGENWKDTKLGDGSGKVIGVVENFYFQDLHEPMSPLLIGLSKAWMNYVAVRIDERAIQQSITAIEKKWTDLESEKPLQIFSLEERIQSLYETESDQTALISIFSLIGIIITCIGLIGLVSYSAKLRAKEIVIRKVLGASYGRLMLLIFSNFLVIFSLAVISSIPIAIKIMNDWLDNYPLRITIDWSYPILSIIIVFMAMAISIGYVATKSVTLNPTTVLKDS